jgi:FdhE protein
MRGEEGARWLVCGRCDAEWRFQRLECPFCGTRDQGNLAYFSGGQGLYRLYVCEECKGYIKAIDLRHSQSEVLLPLEWIGTLDMDRQACELGYRPGEPTTATDSEETQ